MGIAIFIIGAALFLGLGALITYWVFDGDQDEYFYRTIGVIYTMTALVLLYFLLGVSIFGESAHKWIVFFVSIIFAIYLILYAAIYIVMENFSIKVFLLIPSLGVQLWQIYNTWPSAGKEFFSENMYSGLILFVLASMIATQCISLFYSRKKLKKRNSDLLYTRYYRSNSDLPFELFVHHSDASGNASDQISYLVLRLYLYAKDERLTPSRLEAFLIRFEDIISPSVRKRIYNRFMESHYLNRMDSVSLVEFATILFPEFFGNSRFTASSDKYNLRLFEEFYISFQRKFDQNQTQMKEINSKMDKINKLLLGEPDNPVSKVKIENNSESILLSEENSQSIVREISHLTKTPLLTISTALKNLSNHSDALLSETQREKISTISENVITVQLIIDAYRRLTTVSDVATSDAIRPHLETVTSSMCKVCGKQIKTKLSDFPEKVCVHGNNVIIILLMPLIHNAIEASPNGGEVSVRCAETEEHYIITVENICKNLPKQVDLNTDGFSTKADGGEGLRSVRRISKSIGMQFQIRVYNKAKKVIATLRVPKK